MIDLARETLLTRPAAARLMGVSKDTIAGWITRGVRGIRLEAIRPGRWWKTSVEALQRFADARTQQELPAVETTPRGANAEALEYCRQHGLL